MLEIFFELFSLLIIFFILSEGCLGFFFFMLGWRGSWRGVEVFVVVGLLISVMLLVGLYLFFIMILWFFMYENWLNMLNCVVIRMVLKKSVVVYKYCINVVVNINW